MRFRLSDRGRFLSAFSIAILAVILLRAPQSAAFADEEEAFRMSRMLGRGINLGNALEAPVEGEWGVTLKPEFFQAIGEAGFDAVRIPIRWNAHAATSAPFAISPEFFARVDWTIREAFFRNLRVIVNIHHFGELNAEPQKEEPRLLALWEQIASHYRDYPETLYFELLNEPSGQLTDERWQEIFPDVLRTIRKTNPRRMVIIGPAYWNSLDRLEKLQLPEVDRRLIVTFHYYSPMPLTHQEAPWIAGSGAWKGTAWTGTAAEKEALAGDFQKVAAWASQHRRPIFLGEFGAYHAADLGARARWTAAVAREAEKNGFSWAYWELCSGFGAYDAEAHAWRQPLLDALIPKGRRKGALEKARGPAPWTPVLKGNVIVRRVLASIDARPQSSRGGFWTLRAFKIWRLIPVQLRPLRVDPGCSTISNDVPHNLHMQNSASRLRNAL